MISILRTSLLDLLHEVEENDPRLIIGGGFGIYLKTEYVRDNNLRTLLKELPEPRSTNDIDLFLRPELLIHPENLKPLSKAIKRLGYSVIKGAEKYQFVKPGPVAGNIKIDILTGPEKVFLGTSAKADSRRIRPTPSIDLHAHPVNEVVTLEEGLLPYLLRGKLSSGIEYQGTVYLPHPYSFLMMKLFAFKDRIDDSDKEFGRYHALDLYTIVATTTEKEWEDIKEIKTTVKTEPYVTIAGQIVEQYFAKDNQRGIIRLKEGRYYRPELRTNDFISIMKDIFLGA